MSPRPEQLPRRPTGEAYEQGELVEALAEAARRPKTFWTGEAIFAAIAVAITLIVALLGLAWNASTLSSQVASLEKIVSAQESAHRGYEDRMRAIEATASVDRANADKREALIEQGLREINERLSNLQTSVDQLQQHKH